jgi:hypothetical protein
MKKRILFFILFSCLWLGSYAQVIYTIAGNGVSGYSGDGGPAASAVLTSPSRLCYDRRGNLYFTDYARVRKINTTGIITTVAGTGTPGYGGDGGPAISVQMFPAGIAVDSLGNIYLADHDNSVVRKVDTFGIITTIAGNLTYGYSGDGGPAVNAQLNQPNSVAVNSLGELFIGDMNHVIRKVDGSGVITTYAGNGTPGYSGDGGPATSASFS